MKRERFVSLGDTHIPFHDPAAVRAALGFLKDYRPDKLYLHGDIIDCYAISRFCGDPDRRMRFGEEIASTCEHLAAFRAEVPAATIYYLQGNHELRMQRYLWSKAPELSGLSELSLDRLLDLRKLDIRWVSTGWIKQRGLVIKHGSMVRKKSGYTATGEMEAAGMGGIMGHTHRLGQVYRRNMAGVMTWVESGCLCRLDQEYLEGAVPDWQHGLAYGTLGDRPHVHQLHIYHGRIDGAKEAQAQAQAQA